jgi:hypothetical protein
MALISVLRMIESIRNNKQDPRQSFGVQEITVQRVTTPRGANRSLPFHAMRAGEGEMGEVVVEPELSGTTHKHIAAWIWQMTM